MKAFVLPRIDDPVESVMVEGCLRHFGRGEVVERMLGLPNTITIETVERVIRANHLRPLPVVPF